MWTIAVCKIFNSYHRLLKNRSHIITQCLLSHYIYALFLQIFFLCFRPLSRQCASTMPLFWFHLVPRSIFVSAPNLKTSDHFFKIGHGFCSVQAGLHAVACRYFGQLSRSSSERFGFHPSLYSLALSLLLCLIYRTCLIANEMTYFQQQGTWNIFLKITDPNGILIDYDVLWRSNFLHIWHVT